MTQPKILVTAAAGHGAELEHPNFASLVDASVVRRAGIVALVLGSILTLANQPAAIFGKDAVQVLPLLLVYLTPFVVVAISQVLGIRRALLDARRDQASETPTDAFFTSAISHGIPLRSLLVGLIIGTVNTAVVVSAALIDGGDLADLPAALIGQAFALPMLFGVVSQAISYRRAARVIGERLQIEALESHEPKRWTGKGPQLRTIKAACDSGG